MMQQKGLFTFLNHSEEQITHYLYKSLLVK